MSLHTRSAIIYPIVLLSALAALTAWISHVVQAPQPKLDGSSRHDPDYTMSDFVTTQTDINGGLRYQLAAAEMKHYPDNDTTDLQRPRYKQFTVGKPYTQIESLHGYVSSNGEQVQLVDNVKITRQAFANKGEMTIETAYLNILPNEDLVRTDSPVVIRQAPKTIIHATGMTYEKKKNTVTLLHKVRAHYENPRRAVGISAIKKPIIENQLNMSQKLAPMGQEKVTKSNQFSQAKSNDSKASNLKAGNLKPKTSKTNSAKTSISKPKQSKI